MVEAAWLRFWGSTRFGIQGTRLCFSDAMNGFGVKGPGVKSYPGCLALRARLLCASTSPKPSKAVLKAFKT